MIRFLTTALLATTIFGSVTPALAEISPQVAAEHNALSAALTARGISLYLDEEDCHTRPVAGFYHGPSKSLVLCNNGSATMTEDNLDTLRHESIHFIQDCANGAIDGHLRTILEPGQARAMLAQSGQDPEWIRRTYESHGAGAHVPFEEEAFGAAAVMPASAIVQAMDIFCPVIP